ncbi:MAG TPA: CAP domain-containing protein [Actinomycetota bacterium]|nr:CAP domain-containing protein [Actinomycetota bacterium]
MNGISKGRSFAVVLLAVALLGGGCARERVPLAFSAERCTPDSAWPAEHEFFQYEVMRLVNEHRAEMGLSTLGRSVSLQRSAVWKARHLAHYRYFEHDDPAPPITRTYDTRMGDCGYSHDHWPGENIAGGSTPREAMRLWLNSPGHRRAIENPEINAIGVGVAPHVRPDDPYEDGRYYGLYAWVQTFGIDPNAKPLGPAPPSPTSSAALEDPAATADPAPEVHPERCEPDPSWPEARRDMMDEMLRLMNDRRAENGVPALQRSEGLERSTVWGARHSATAPLDDMDAEPAPATPPELADCGYTTGETEFYGWADRSTPADNMDSRLDPGWFDHLGDRSITLVGIGIATDSAGYFHYRLEFGSDSADLPPDTADEAGDSGDVAEDPATNQAPVARPDFGRLRRGRTLSFEVLANDSDPEGLEVTLISIGSTRFGSARATGTSITYRATRRGIGQREKITYVIRDADGATAQGVLTIAIK